jgi:predicted site-specific integrase-resolvase
MQIADNKDMRVSIGRAAEELARDVREILTVFSARLYASRSHKNRQLVEKCQEAAEAL